MNSLWFNLLEWHRGVNRERQSAIATLFLHINFLVWTWFVVRSSCDHCVPKPRTRTIDREENKDVVGMHIPTHQSQTKIPCKQSSPRRNETTMVPVPFRNFSFGICLCHCLVLNRQLSIQFYHCECSGSLSLCSGAPCRGPHPHGT